MRNFEKSPNPQKKIFFGEVPFSLARTSRMSLGYRWDIVGHRGTSWDIVGTSFGEVSAK